MQTMSDLNGVKVAILVTDGFEHAEMVEPRKDPRSGRRKNHLGFAQER